MADNYIGAVWFLNATEAGSIHSAFQYSMWVIVSQNGLSWDSIESTGDIPDVGDLMTGGAWFSDKASHQWEYLRLYIIGGHLGLPKFGTNPLQTVVQKIPMSRKNKSSCWCEIRILMMMGCASARGNSCPNKIG